MVVIDGAIQGDKEEGGGRREVSVLECVSQEFKEEGGGRTEVSKTRGV